MKHCTRFSCRVRIPRCISSGTCRHREYDCDRALRFAPNGGKRVPVHASGRRDSDKMDIVGMNPEFGVPTVLAKRGFRYVVRHAFSSCPQHFCTPFPESVHCAAVCCRTLGVSDRPGLQRTALRLQLSWDSFRAYSLGRPSKRCRHERRCQCHPCSCSRKSLVTTYL